MRTDVKLGVVTAAVLVLVAGGYFLLRDDPGATVAVITGPGEGAGDKGLEPTEARPRRTGADDPARGASPDRRTAHPPASRPEVQPGRATRGESERRPALTTRPVSPQDTRRTASARPQGPAGAGETPGEASPMRAVEAPAETPDVANADVARTERDERAAQGAVEAPVKPAPIDDGAVDSSKEQARRLPTLAATRRAETRRGSTTTGEGDAAVDLHRVQPGDTFVSLSQRYYGGTEYVRFLIESNPQVARPEALRVGQVIRIPPRPSTPTAREPRTEAPAAAARTTPERRTYTVQPGDSFYKIARDVLGDAARWKELFELNEHLVDGDPKRLRIGQEIQLPVP